MHGVLGRTFEIGEIVGTRLRRRYPIGILQTAAVPDHIETLSTQAGRHRRPKVLHGGPAHQSDLRRILQLVRLGLPGKPLSAQAGRIGFAQGRMGDRLRRLPLLVRCQHTLGGSWDALRHASCQQRCAEHSQGCPTGHMGGVHIPPLTDRSSPVEAVVATFHRDRVRFMVPTFQKWFGSGNVARDRGLRGRILEEVRPAAAWPPALRGRPGQSLRRPSLPRGSLSRRWPSPRRSPRRAVRRP